MNCEIKRNMVDQAIYVTTDIKYEIKKTFTLEQPVTIVFYFLGLKLCGLN